MDGDWFGDKGSMVDEVRFEFMFEWLRSVSVVS
jgi:hypothetical protein